MADKAVSMAEVKWQALFDKANKEVKAGNHAAKRTLETLERLREACEAIVSGKAIAEADSLKKSKKDYFSQVAAPENIHQYCVEIKGYGGPHPVSIRRNHAWLDYIKERNEEAPTHHKPARPSSHQASVDRALRHITDMDDRDLLWKEIEAGRKASAERNILLEFFSTYSSVNLAQLSGNKITLDSLRGAGNNALGSGESEVLRVLMARLTDNEYLEQFDLKYGFQSISMGYGAGTKLMYREEVALLFKLAGMAKKDHDDDPGDLEPA